MNCFCLKFNICKPHFFLSSPSLSFFSHLLLICLSKPLQHTFFFSLDIWAKGLIALQIDITYALAFSVTLKLVFQSAWRFLFCIILDLLLCIGSYLLQMVNWQFFYNFPWSAGTLIPVTIPSWSTLILWFISETIESNFTHFFL